MKLTSSSHQHISSHLHHAETDSSSNYCIQTAFNITALQQVNITMTNQLAPEIYRVQVFDIDLHHLPKIGWLNVDHQFYVEISTEDVNGGMTSCTGPEKHSSMPWSSKHVFNVRNSTTIALKVFVHRQLHNDQYVGMVQGCVEEFLTYPGAILEQLKYINPQDKEEPLRASLEFKIAPIVCTGRPVRESQRTETGHREGIWKGPITSHGHGDAVRTPFPPAVQIFDIDLHHLPRISLFSIHDSFYVHVSVDGHDHTSTTAEKPHSLPWTTELKLNVRASSVISLKVFAKRRLHGVQYIGMVEEGVETLLGHSKTKIYRLVSFDPHGNKRLLCASMEFKIVPLHNEIEHNTTQDGEGQLARTIDASKDTSMPNMGGYGPNEPLKQSTEQVVGVVVSEILTPLLDKINIFVQLAGKFAEAHPYTKMAFMVLTAVYQVVDAQFARDRNIRRLITIMHETYSLVSGVEELKRVESQEKTINSLARQTIECSYFIRDYLQNRSGWKQSFSNALSNLDDKIRTYEETFKELKNAIQQQAAIHTELYVFRVHDLLLDHAAKTDLDGMHYAFGASIESQKIGNAPPRTDIVESITSWVNQDNKQQIYLLLGPKGSGKSTIAHTIAHQFDAIVRLGSSYCFSRADQDKRNATNLFSTIARDLADHDPQYMKALWGTVKDKRASRQTINPLIQFDRFILIPARQMTCIGPVLVIIDGLEYSGSELARKDLLTALAEKAADLPCNFKFLVTCRPEDDICTAFEGKSHVIMERLKHHADSLSHEPGPPPTSGKNKTNRPKFRPPTPPLSIPEYTGYNLSPGTGSSMIVTSNSTPISGNSGSGSAVSTVFDTWDDGCDSTESPPSSASSIDEEPQPSKKKLVVQVTRRSQEFITVEQISETGGRTIRETSLETLESWIVEQHDRPQSGLLLKELGIVASAEPANDLPPMSGLSGCSGRLPKRPRQKQVRAKTLIRHTTIVDGAGILGRDDDLECR